MCRVRNVVDGSQCHLLLDQILLKLRFLMRRLHLLEGRRGSWGAGDKTHSTLLSRVGTASVAHVLGVSDGIHLVVEALLSRKPSFKRHLCSRQRQLLRRAACSSSIRRSRSSPLCRMRCSLAVPLALAVCKQGALVDENLVLQRFNPATLLVSALRRHTCRSSDGSSLSSRACWLRLQCLLWRR